ncbi:hypothetical protein M2266_000438 [Streptomyces sp. SPB162]|nr:hypothetical protein [Streptomyces sp. SPB162]
MASAISALTVMVPQPDAAPPWCTVYSPDSTAARTSTEPTDRSIPATMMTKVMPTPSTR